MRCSYMDNFEHTVFECKYHIVFIQKFRRKEIYGTLRRQFGRLNATKKYKYSF